MIRVVIQRPRVRCKQTTMSCPNYSGNAIRKLQSQVNFRISSKVSVIKLQLTTPLLTAPQAVACRLVHQYGHTNCTSKLWVHNISFKLIMHVIVIYNASVNNSFTQLVTYGFSWDHSKLYSSSSCSSSSSQKLLLPRLHPTWCACIRLLPRTFSVSS